MKKELSSLILNFKNYSLAVLGDVMLDYNIAGRVSRISPEAPIPVVDVNSIRYLPGGAANVASNLHHLGARVHLMGVVGDDDNAKHLRNSLDVLGIESQGLILDKSRPTTTKMRVFSGHHPFIRADFESTVEISKDIENRLYRQVEEVVTSVDALIFEDYNKGLLSKSLIHSVIDLCRKHRVMTAVDPKFRNFFEYQNVSIFKPNRKELLNAFGKTEGDLHQVKDLAKELLGKIHCEQLLLTLSEEGMLMVSEKEIKAMPSLVKEVLDPAGAGDAVIASFVLAYLSSKDTSLAMEIASLAAAVNCRKVGVSPISSIELIEEMSKL